MLLAGQHDPPGVTAVPRPEHRLHLLGAVPGGRVAGHPQPPDTTDHLPTAAGKAPERSVQTAGSAAGSRPRCAPSAPVCHDH